MVFPPLSHPPSPSFSAYIPRPGIKITITPLSLPSRHSSGSTPTLINSPSALRTCTHEAGCGLEENTRNLNGSSFQVMIADLKCALHAGDGLLPYPILLPCSRLFFNAPPRVPSSQPFGFHHLPSQQALLFPWPEIPPRRFIVTEMLLTPDPILSWWANA